MSKSEPPSFSAREISETFRGWINDSEYEKLYPEINLPNCFSISTLSTSVDKQVYWKQKAKVGIQVTYNEAMWEGKSAHEYFQRRLVAAGWQIEYPLRVVIPYTWEHRDLKDIILLGHIDAYHPVKHAIVEIKRSRKNPFIYPNHLLQAGAYAYLLAPHAGERYPATFVVKVNTMVRTREMNVYEITASGGLIQKRALEAAKRLDIEQGNKKTILVQN